MITPNPGEQARLDQMLAGVRGNLETVVEAAAVHLSGECPTLGRAPRELVVAHLTQELENITDSDACFEMLALAAVQLAERRRRRT